MGLPLLINRRQVAAAIGTEGTFTAGNMIAANANIVVYSAKSSMDVNQYERQPLRGTLGAVASIPGARLGKITLSSELKGSGTPGTAPAIGRLIRACGFGETIVVGTGITSVTGDAKNASSAAILPLVAGTYGGALSGTYVITLTAIVASTSATFEVAFYPDNNSAASFQNITLTSLSTSAITVPASAGLTLATTLNPNTAASPAWRVGDKWTVTAYANSRVDYEPINTAIPCLDMGIYKDGRIEQFHTCRGSFKLSGKLGQPVMLDFSFTGIIYPAAGTVDGPLLSSIPFQNVAPPPFLNLGATLGGVSPQCFTNLDIDIGNDVKASQCANSASGYDATYIVSRKVTGSIDPRGAVAATFNPYTSLFSGATAALSLTVGSTPGNIIVLSSPAVQTTGVDDDERDGVTVDKLNLRFNEPEFSGSGQYAEFKMSFQ